MLVVQKVQVGMILKLISMPISLRNNMFSEGNTVLIEDSWSQKYQLEQLTLFTEEIPKQNISRLSFQTCGLLPQKWCSTTRLLAQRPFGKNEKLVQSFWISRSSTKRKWELKNDKRRTPWSVIITNVLEVSFSIILIFLVLPSKQQKFFLTPLRLRDLLIKKATDVTWNKAARKI